MKRPSPTPPNPSVPPGARGFAALVLVVGLALALGSVADGAWNAGQAPVPYAWRDVALVHLLCALPLAGMLAVVVYARVPAAGVVGIAVGGLVVGVVPLSTDLTGALRAEPFLGIVLRSLSSLGLALWAMLVAAVLIGVQRPAAGLRIEWKPALALGLLGITALALPPTTYVGARCRHDVARLGEFIEQSRFGEAQMIVRGLLVLDARRTLHGQPLSEVAEKIEQIVEQLESQVAIPLRAYPTTGERVARARALAMLGRTDEALEVLKPVNDPQWTPDVESLRGTIYETRGDWNEGLTAYRAAKAAWESRPTSQVRVAGILRATTGIAYCLRKRGQYAQAESAYQEVLALAPTADTHFLLAQFYQDTQQAEKARVHARRAMELAPERYQPEGEKLIKKMMISEFGCLSVFNAEDSGRGLPSLPK